MTNPASSQNSGSTARAVFLSYSHDDVAAARRLAEALREAGVEVWFDANELRGGDAWDAAIKRQIRDCALFLPVISAQTQAREEAYFRREWKLAVGRTHDMADTVPFLLPVVIDDTLEAGALVPEQFMRAQWTRLPRGLPTPQFVDEVRRQLARSSGQGGVGEAHMKQTRREDPRATARAGKRAALAVALVMVALVVAGGWWWTKKSVGSVSGAGVDSNNVALISAKSIAVLPFANLSGDKENEYFADGVHDELLTNLNNLRDLGVISRTSVLEYRGTTKKIQQIARELGVAYVLEGSVRRAGGKVRIVCQLIDGRTGLHVWSPPPYDRPFDDIFAIQSELAQTIATKLKAAISPDEKSALETAPTSSLAAYDLYLKARQARLTESNPRTAVEQAQPLLESAVQYDPKFAMAWLELGLTHLRAFNTIDPSDARRSKSKEALDTAERLDPKNPSILAALGNYYIDTEDRPQAEAMAERVSRQFPDRAETYQLLARLAWRMQGDDALATDNYRKAHTLDPRNPALVDSLRNELEGNRLYDEAEALVRQSADLHWNNLGQAYAAALVSFRARGSVDAVEKFFAGLTPEQRRTDPLAIRSLANWALVRGDADGLIRIAEEAPGFRNLLAVGAAYLVKGQPEKARPLLEKNRDQLRTLLGSAPARRFSWLDLAITEAMLGNRPEALAARQKMADIPGLRGPGYAFDDAVIFAWLGDKEQALAAFARDIRTGQGAYYSKYVHEARRSLYLWPLHGDPRFEAILNDPKNNAPLL